MPKVYDALVLEDTGDLGLAEKRKKKKKGKE